VWTTQRDRETANETEFSFASLVFNNSRKSLRRHDLIPRPFRCYSVFHTRRSRRRRRCSDLVQASALLTKLY